MAKKADIRGDLNLDSTGVDRAVQSANKSIKGFVTSSIKTIGALAGAAGFGAAATAAVDMAKEIRTLSKLSGETVEDFQRYAIAAKTVNIEQEKLGDMFKDVQDKIGDFLQTGAGPMADFFETIGPKIGVVADDFRGLSGKDALQLYYDSIEKANVS